MMKKIKQNFKDMDWDYIILQMVLKYGTEHEKKDYLWRKFRIDDSFTTPNELIRIKDKL